jgi:hypothetical protein
MVPMPSERAGGRAATPSPGSASTPALLVARRRPAPVWAALLAAAAVVVAVLGFTAGSASRADPIHQLDGQIAVLQEATAMSLHIEAQPDARHVALAASTGDGAASGSLVFSPATGELVVVAMGLPHEGSGEEYGCWVEIDGTRHRLGRMYWGGDVAAWSGPASGLSNLPAGTTFGVSLGPPGGGVDAVPVLTGSL